MTTCYSISTATAIRQKADSGPVSYKAADGSTIIFNVFSGGTLFFGHYMEPADTQKYPAVGTYDTADVGSVVSWTASLENLPTPSDDYKYVNHHKVVSYVGQFASNYLEITTTFTIQAEGAVKAVSGEKTFKLVM